MATQLQPVAFALFQAKLFALLGLLLGIIYSVGGLVVDSMVSLGWLVSSETPGLSEGTLLAFGALIGMPLIAAAVGLIIGLIGALLYNFWSACFGSSDITLTR